MNCSDVDESLDAQAAGLLDEVRGRELREHVGHCSDCDARAGRLSRLEDALRSPQDLEEQAALRVPRLRARLRSELLVQGRPRGESRGKLLLVAGSLAVCLLLLKFIVWPPGSSGTPASPTVPPEAPAQTVPPKQERAEDPPPTLESLVARLADDRPDVRSEAARKLVEMGPSILPLLRKRPPLEDAEARGRLSDVLRRLEESESIPPFRGVSLEAKGKAAHDVLLEIAAQAGISPDAFAFESAGGDPAPVSLKDATPLQAIDEVCRKTFALSYRRGMQPYDRSLHFFTAPFEERPTAYVRHYKVRALPVDAPATREKGRLPYLVLEISWPPQILPYAMTGVQDLLVSDDQGRVLNGDIPRMGRSQFSPIAFSKDRTEPVLFRFPEEGTRTLSLRGHVEFRYARERSPLVFDAPADQKGKILHADGLTLSLKEFKQKDREILIEFEAVGKADPTLTDRFAWTDVEVITASGEKLMPGYKSRMTSNGKTAVWQATLQSSKPEAVREIRIGVVRSFCVDRAEFEIKGIPYPK